VYEGHIAVGRICGIGWWLYKEARYQNSYIRSLSQK